MHTLMNKTLHGILCVIAGSFLVANPAEAQSASSSSPRGKSEGEQRKKRVKGVTIGAESSSASSGAMIYSDTNVVTSLMRFGFSLEELLAQDVSSLLGLYQSGNSQALVESAQRVKALGLGFDVTYDKDLAFSRQESLTYDKLFPSSYNKALVRLIADYSGSARLVDSVNVFASESTSKQAITNETLLSKVFTPGGKNTDLLGLRSVSYFNPEEKNLGYRVGQGEMIYHKSINYVGGNGITLDVTKTVLEEVKGGSKKSEQISGARAFSVVALGDSNVSGKVTFSNKNRDTGTTRNVLAIGAVGTLTVKNNSKLDYSSGRVIAVGAGKLKGEGSNGEVNGLELSSKGVVAIASGQNVKLVDAKINVTHEKGKLLVYAENTIDLKSPTFASKFGKESEVYLDARTVNLTAVNFPEGSKVKLFSEKGAIDGKYPSFGRVLPGRVNFIKDVSYGGASVMNKQSFDTNGGNISIGKGKF